MEKVGSRLIAKENYHREGKPGLLKEVKREPLNNVLNKLPVKNFNATKKADRTENRQVDKPIKTENRQVDKPIKTAKQPTVKEIINRTDSLLIKKEVKIEETVTSYSSNQLIGILDVDELDNDPMLVSEYIKDIMTYLAGLEDKYMLKPSFLSQKHSTKPRMRAVLVNWLAEVHTNFKFLVETFHLSISILDRYLDSNPNVGKENLQLVGTTATYLAAKYEEMYTPDIGDFVFICDGLYTKEQIFKMEIDILIRLDFTLGLPLPIHFLRRYSRIIKATPQHHILAKYLIELAMFEYDLCHNKPSLIAAASCCLSICLLNGIENPARAWTRTIKHYSSYDFSNIKEIVGYQCKVLLEIEKSKYQSIRARYCVASVGKIALNSKLKGPIVKKLAEPFLVHKK